MCLCEAAIIDKRMSSYVLLSIYKGIFRTNQIFITELFDRNSKQYLTAVFILDV